MLLEFRHVHICAPSACERYWRRNNSMVGKNRTAETLGRRPKCYKRSTSELQPSVSKLSSPRDTDGLQSSFMDQGCLVPPRNTWLEVMLGVAPDVVSYCTLISACGVWQVWHAAVRVHAARRDDRARHRAEQLSKMFQKKLDLKMWTSLPSASFQHVSQLLVVRA